LRASDRAWRNFCKLQWCLNLLYGALDLKWSTGSHLDSAPTAGAPLQDILGFPAVYSLDLRGLIVERLGDKADKVAAATHAGNAGATVPE